MSNKCECGGYMHAEEFDSQMLHYRLEKEPVKREEVEEYLHIKNLTAKAVWFLICSECDEIRIYQKSLRDRNLDSFRRDTY